MFSPLRVAASVLLLACCLRASTNVFEMPLIQPRQRHLQQQLLLTARSGKIDEMEAICREGVELLPLDATWRYNLACALAYRADKGPALDALERAIEMGFRDLKTLRADQDLKQLAAEPRFAELLRRAEEQAGKPWTGAGVVRPSLVVMGKAAEVNASNTLWDYEVGCFRTLFSLIRPEVKRNAAYADAYSGPAAGRVGAWLREERASGNFGDLYVNRDNGHSRLAVTNFPGLTPVTYAKEAQACRVHVSMPNALFEQPVIGNCSMSMVQGPYWRSLPRAALTDPSELVFLMRCYLGNQSWFFPEHKDYDPELGDLYPANAPFYVISQGSSYSDQPFLRAFAAAMAALRPETKRALVAGGALAPTLQMLFRATQRTVRVPEDYLTGAAHPAVFDAANLDVDALVERAQALEPAQIPPLVALRTVTDLRAEAGVDYFDGRPEGLFDTPFCIARVARAVARERRMTLEAAVSSGRRDVTFVWTVLQGDPKKVVIRPLNAQTSRVEIAVSYHGVYRPVTADGSPAKLTTGRVDIGCFVKAGDYYSAPAIVSLYYLPNEERVYRDDGQILSVDYTNAARRYADPALTLQKGWKDLYAYDAQGRLTGWFRTRATGAPQRFTSQGHRVLETDRLDRPVKACAVQYLPRQEGENTPAVLTTVDLPKAFTYTYADDTDRIGRAAAER